MLHCPLPSTPGNHARVSMHCYPIDCVIKSIHRGICSCSPIVLNQATSLLSSINGYQNTAHVCGTISYLSFADADTGIYPRAASHCHARPKANRGFMMLSVDKFPYLWSLTRCYEVILSWNDVYPMLKRFPRFKSTCRLNHLTYC